MKKICTVVGARPQFIKLAVVSRALRRNSDFHEVIIHTGQHYDHNMSDVFFEELDIPHPDYNLGVSGGTHGQMTGRMIEKIEEVLMREKPDMLLLLGDTNSTMAGALAGVKLGIPICHVEAGDRGASLSNPEEVNRIVTDHVSSLLFACTAAAMEHLVKEDLSQNAFLLGDPMYDAFRYYSALLDGTELECIEDFNGEHVAVPSEFYYMTCHRQENTDTDEKLDNILAAMECLDAPVLYPVHPRNRERANRLCSRRGYRNTLLTLPVGYKTSISLVNHAKKIVTDSGGLLREAFFAKRQCVTIFDSIVSPETMINNCNQLAKPEKDDILRKLSAPARFEENYCPYGDGHSAEKMAQKIKDYLL